MNSQEKKNFAEKIHIEYLLSNLALEVFNPAGGFDLVSERHLLELKSKLCLFNSRTHMDNIWWALSDPQIQDYEARYAENGKGFLWIFLHAFTNKPSSELRSKRQLGESIYRRDVFIAPWEVYESSPVGRTGDRTKTGPYRHVGRKRLLEMVDFYETPIENGKLYLPKNSDLEYLVRKIT